MSKARPRFVFEPATMTWAEAAEYAFRKSESWLRGHIHDIPGFPRPDPVYSTFSKAQVDAWIARRFGLALDDARDRKAALMERARGTDQGALSRRETA
jgi:hypothetical protein